VRLTLRAPAKLNLFLEVLGRRPDGYHEIRTVMHPISLYDRLTFRALPSGRVKLEGDTAELGELNLVARAARVLSKRVGRRLGAHVVIRKGIPTGGGLGGGSSDAAATLQALARLHRLDLPPGGLEAAAADVGSDVAFFVSARTALCSGRGERITPLQPAGKLDFVLVDPGVPLSTARVYQALKLALTHHPKDASQFVRTWSRGDLRRIGGSLFNRLERPAFKLAPSLKKLKKRLTHLRVLGTLMSGSGSCVYALVHGAAEARETAARMRRTPSPEGWRVRTVRTADCDLDARQAWTPE